MFSPRSFEFRRVPAEESDTSSRLASLLLCLLAPKWRAHEGKKGNHRGGRVREIRSVARMTLRKVGWWPKVSPVVILPVDARWRQIGYGGL